MAYFFFNLQCSNLSEQCIFNLVLLVEQSIIQDVMIQYFLVIFLDGSPTCYRAFMGHMFYITNICFTMCIINLIPVCIYLWVNLYLYIILKLFTFLYIYIYVYIYIFLNTKSVLLPNTGVPIPLIINICLTFVNMNILPSNDSQ